MQFTLKQWRGLREMSRRELSERAGISEQTISKWENGKGNPTLKNLKSVADVLEINIEDILLP